MEKELSYSAEKTWDIIAQSFHNTRRKPWKQCISFIENISIDSTVLDLGCGNGRHLIPIAKKSKKAIGVDISSNLLKIIQNRKQELDMRNIELIHANLIDLPIKTESIDSALYIAALHNIKIRENRIKSLQELYRVLKKECVALISVWSRDQEKFYDFFNNQKYNQYIKNKDFEDGDIEIYWKQNKLNIPRFYHLYKKNEFEKDLITAGFKIVKIKNEFISSKEIPDNYFSLIIKMK
jgi:ubiquinone/menaquinone biosynthesis C-methylase UbiE